MATNAGVFLLVTRVSANFPNLGGGFGEVRLVELFDPTKGDHTCLGYRRMATFVKDRSAGFPPSWSM